jgi:hypothetical protein
MSAHWPTWHFSAPLHETIVNSIKLMAQLSIGTAESPCRQKSADQLTEYRHQSGVRLQFADMPKGWFQVLLPAASAALPLIQANEWLRPDASSAPPMASTIVKLMLLASCAAMPSRGPKLTSQTRPLATTVKGRRKTPSRHFRHS